VGSQYREDGRLNGSVCTEGLVVVRGSVIVGGVPCVSVRVFEEAVGAQVPAEDVDDALMVGALVGVGHFGQCVNSGDAHLRRRVSQLLNRTNKFFICLAALKCCAFTVLDD